MIQHTSTHIAGCQDKLLDALNLVHPMLTHNFKKVRWVQRKPGNLNWPLEKLQKAYVRDRLTHHL